MGLVENATMKKLRTGGIALGFGVHHLRTAAAGMIISATEAGTESAAERLARLVRASVPPGAHLNLPAEEEAAIAQLRKALQGFFRHE